MSSRDSPRARPPSAYPSKSRAPISSRERRLSSLSVPPWAMPKRSWPSARGASTWRSAQRVVSSTARARSASRRVGRRADVEAHRDVGAEPALDLRDALGREPLGRAVVDRAERDPFLVEREDRVAEREHLEAAGVREDGPLPAGERVDAAEALDELLARPEMEVVRVAQDDVRSQRSDLVGMQRLHGRLGADGHEGGSRDRRRARS